jgi:type I restriction enzyme S subunit
MEKLQPKLRFPEFKEDWVCKQLTNICELTSSKRVYLFDYVEVGVPFYRGKEISELKENKEPSDVLYISEDSYNDFKSKYGVPLIDDILMTAVGTLGNVYRIRNEKPFYFKDGNLIWFRKIKENSTFLEILLDYKNNDIQKTSIGSTQRALTMVELRKLFFNFPSPPEQTKIATFLSSVDEKLNLLKEKKALLEEYKKGMMQQIFSQQLRFKDEDGKDFEDWKQRRLNKLVKIYDGTHQTPSYVESGIAFYSVEHVTANQFSKTKFISKEVYEKENKRVKLEKDDILMTKIGSIGVPRLIDWDVEASFYVSLALLKKSSNISNKYLVHFINSTFFQNELWKRTIHVAFPQKINLGEIGECIVIFPCATEQSKIANFLSAIDEKIELVAQQIEDTQEYKRGLLQGMFC